MSQQVKVSFGLNSEQAAYVVAAFARKSIGIAAKDAVLSAAQRKLKRPPPGDRAVGRPRKARP